ncbi:MAG: AI-2E family transporter [Pseudohongiellaceae bacterium]
MSSFSFVEFYQQNRRVLIWVVLFGLLWLLRDFFGLVFMTFVLAFVAAPLAEFGTRRLRLAPRFSLSLVYLLYLGTLIGFISFVAPSVADEVNRLIGNLPQIEQRLIDTKNALVQRYPDLREPINGFLRSALPDETIANIDRELATERSRLGIAEDTLNEQLALDQPPQGVYATYLDRQDMLHLNALLAEQMSNGRTLALGIVTWLYRATATMLLALLFSFLLLLDLKRIVEGVQRLRQSRVADFYEVAATPVVRFGVLVGRAIEAQGMIAVVNTVLTLIGLLLLKIPLLMVLGFIVFVCSFIPVLGVFISTTPVVLVALNAGGIGLSLWVVALITLIHVVEAYLLNPLIYGKHLRLNPVLTLVILYVGYHGFGLWGMLLGVPVSRYLLHDGLAVGLRNRSAPEV